MAGISNMSPQVVLECRKMFGTTMLLLGFDVAACEKNFKVTFSRDMFTHINKKGSEVVLHFLFNKLDSSLAYEEFRDCWPVYTKKNDAEFRKRCSTWLERIAKEEPSSRLPRRTASYLMSPGGNRFELFIMRFSAHVLRMVTLRSAKSENIYVSSFVTSPGNFTPALKDVTKEAMKVHIARHTQNVVDRLEVTCQLHEEWKQYASQLTMEYLSTSKQIRQAKKKLDDLIEARKERASAGTLQVQSSADERVRTLTAEVVERQRASKMAKVQELWKQFDDFLEQTAYYHEVIQSILDGEANKYSFDARNISLEVPEVVMKEYERTHGEQLRSPYQQGKLDLISYIRLWNASLRLLRDKLLEIEIPDFDAKTHYLEEEHKKQITQLTSIRELRSSLAELKESVRTTTEKLEANLEKMRGKPQFQASGIDETQPVMLHIPPIIVPSLELELTPPPTPPTSHDHITCSTTQHTSPVPLPTLGFDLMSPSPPRPAVSTTPTSKVTTPHVVRKLTDEVSTPEAIHNISESVRMKTQQQKPLTSKEVTFSSETTLQKKHTTPQSASIHPPVSQSVPIHPPVSQSVPIKPTISHTTSSKKPPISTKRTAGTVSSSSIPSGKKALKSQPTSSSKLAISQRRPQANDDKKQSSPHPVETPLLQAMPKAHVILAEQIAAAVATGKETSDSSLDTPFSMLHSVTDPVSAMGTDAFVSRDKIPRTPLRKGVEKLQFDTPPDDQPLLQEVKEEEEASSSDSNKMSSHGEVSPDPTQTYFQTPVKSEEHKPQTDKFTTPTNSLWLLEDVQPPTPFYLLSMSSQEAVLTSLDDSQNTSSDSGQTDEEVDLIDLHESNEGGKVPLFPEQPTVTPTTIVGFQPLYTSTANKGPGASELVEQPSDSFD